MSSVLASTSNVKQGNAFFVVLNDAATGDLLTAAAGNSSVNVARVAEGTVLRDMGKTIRVPANLLAGSKPEILRKVQIVNTAAMTTLSSGVPANGFVNFNEGVGGDAEFYVRLVPGARGVIVASTGC